MFNKDITVINKRFNKTTKSDDYVITHLKGFYSSNDGISINGTDLVKTDSMVCRIKLEGYITPSAFQNGGTGWTMQNDDYIVKGIVNSVTSLTNLKKQYECFKVSTVSLKDYGSKKMQHIEVSGN